MYVSHYLGEANERDVFVLRSVLFGVCDRGAVMRNASAPLFPLPLVFPLGEVGSTDLGRRNGQRASITLTSLYKHIYTASREFLSPKKCYYSLGMQTAFPGEARTAVITDRCPEAKYPRSTSASTTQRQMGFLFVESFKMKCSLKFISNPSSEVTLSEKTLQKSASILYFCVHSLQNWTQEILPVTLSIDQSGFQLLFSWWIDELFSLYNVKKNHHNFSEPKVLFFLTAQRLFIHYHEGQ